MNEHFGGYASFAADSSPMERGSLKSMLGEIEWLDDLSPALDLAYLIKGLLDRGHAVERQRSDQMNPGRAARTDDVALAYLIALQAGQLLGERNMGGGVVGVESGRVGRGFIDDDEIGHKVLPDFVVIAELS